MNVIGIDPGLRLTGYACLQPATSTRAPSPCTLIEAGCFRFPARRSIAERLVELEADLSNLIEVHHPQAIGVESLFSHFRHPRTAITMAHARGVILLVAERRGVPLVELPPAEVKRALTGNGRASKAQVQRAVQSQLSLPEPPEPPDVADAIAVAICTLTRSQNPQPV